MSDHSLVFAPNQSKYSPSTGMYCNSFRVPQSCHNVTSGFVSYSEGYHRFIGTGGPKQDFGGPVISHGINRSYPVACQDLLDWEWIHFILFHVLQQKKKFLSDNGEWANIGALSNHIEQKFTSAIEVRLVNKPSGPVVVKQCLFIPVKLHSRARERCPKPWEGQCDVFLERHIQWDSPNPQRRSYQHEVLQLCSKIKWWWLLAYSACFCDCWSSLKNHNTFYVINVWLIDCV